MSDNKLAFDPIPVSRPDPAPEPPPLPPLPRATDLLGTRFPSTPLPPLSDAPAGLLPPPKPSPLIPIPPPAVRSESEARPSGKAVPPPSLTVGPPTVSAAAPKPVPEPPAAEPPAAKPPIPSKTAWVAEVLRLAVTPTKRKAVVAAGLASLIGGATAAKHLWPLPPPRTTPDTAEAVTARAADPDPPAPLPVPPPTLDQTPPAAAIQPVVPVVDLSVPVPTPTPAATPVLPPEVLPRGIAERATPVQPTVELPPPGAIELAPPGAVSPPVGRDDGRPVLPLPEIVPVSNPGTRPEPEVPLDRPAAAALMGVALSTVPPTAPVRVEPPKPDLAATPPAPAAPVELAPPIITPTPPAPTVTAPPPPADPPKLTFDQPKHAPDPKPIDPSRINLDPPAVKPAAAPPGDPFKAIGAKPAQDPPPPVPVVVNDPPPVVKPAPAVGELPPTAPPVRPAANVETVTDFDVDLHEVKPGDTYATISRKYLGDDRYAEAIRAYNEQNNPDRGRKVHVPPIHVLRKRYPTLIGRPATGTPEASGTREGAEGGYKSYTVPPGGVTLKGVARVALGDELEWRKVWDLNPKFSPQEVIPEGTRLTLPAGAKIGR